MQIWRVTQIKKIPENIEEIKPKLRSQLQKKFGYSDFYHLPVSWLRLEYHEEGQLRSLESSSPDQNGKITFQAANQDEERELKDYIVVKGTPTLPAITMNQVIEGVLTEDVSNPGIPFHIEQLQRGSFTIVVSIDGREKLCETIFSL
jgi:hypothetical protein